MKPKQTRDMIFSIVTPTFKQPEWVRLCAASVADQVGVASEHIIQDGGGGQGLECLDSIPTARLFIEPDRGMYDALTKGISRAAGDVISHLNSDEQYLPGTLEFVQDFFTRNPEIEVLFGDAILIDADGKPLSYRRVVSPLRSHTVACHLGTLTCSTFFRRTVVERGLSYAGNWKDVGDAALILSWLNARVKMAAIHRPLAVFTFTGVNRSRGKIARQEGDMFRAQGDPQRLLHPTLLATHHRVRKLLAGAYRKWNLSIEIFTRTRPEHRQKIVAHKVGFRWPEETVALYRQSGSNRLADGPF
jgi:glycosyltransferase involved in cell wall biosynthesis